jgi:hypothetical protein
MMIDITITQFLIPETLTILVITILKLINFGYKLVHIQALNVLFLREN